MGCSGQHRHADALDGSAHVFERDRVAVDEDDAAVAGAEAFAGADDGGGGFASVDVVAGEGGHGDGSCAFVVEHLPERAGGGGDAFVVGFDAFAVDVAAVVDDDDEEHGDEAAVAAGGQDDDGAGGDAARHHVFQALQALAHVVVAGVEHGAGGGAVAGEAGVDGDDHEVGVDVVDVSAEERNLGAHGQRLWHGLPMRIELQGVFKSYGEVSVVVDLSLDLPSGKVTALLGPSGCGKTTTLRMIAGLERVTRGVIKIGDRVVDDGAGVFVAPEDRGLGMVFQSYALWPHKTVRENVGYPLTLQRQARAVVDERAQRALASVRLAELAARYPHQLSGGQQQRVAVARALIGNGERPPPVLLLDEPLANLDARLREEMRAELAAAARASGATVVAVTHDQQEAFALADSVVVLERGRLAQTGSPEDIYLRPSSSFVGGFGGPMAFFPVARRDGAASVCGVVVDPANVAGDLSSATTLGIRPEWFTVSRADEGGGSGIAVVVEQRLFLGREHEVVVVTTEGGHRVALRLPSTSPAPAPGTPLWLQPTRACAFTA